MKYTVTFGVRSGDRHGRIVAPSRKAALEIGRQIAKLMTAAEPFGCVPRACTHLGLTTTEHYINIDQGVTE